MLITSWRMKLRQNKQLPKLGWAAVVGITVGIAAASFSVHRHPVNTAAASIPYIVPVNLTPPVSAASGTGVATASFPRSGDQLEKLETRNRRLEALVAVLRRRAATERR